MAKVADIIGPKAATTAKGRKLEALVTSGRRSAARAREALAQFRMVTLYGAPAASLGGAAAAGLVDGAVARYVATPMKVEASTVLGIITAVGGVAMQSPSVASAGSGMLGASVYNKARALITNQGA